MKKKTLFLCRAAVIAALYVILTLILRSDGMIQCRLSEALCVLPFFTGAAVPGLTVGCLIANLMTGNIFDIIFGTLATLIGASFAYLLRKTGQKWISFIPNIVANTLIIPFVLKYGYGIAEGLPMIMLFIFIGEVISSGVLGCLLIPVLDKYKNTLFN